MTQKYSWVPDMPDFRDYKFVAVNPKIQPTTDLRVTTKFSEVYDQGMLGSCTANAIGAAIEWDMLNNHTHIKTTPFMPSRLFIYYNERVIERTVPYDSGAMLRDGIKTVAKEGVCKETLWPYYIDKFRVRPTYGCYSSALKFKTLTYYRLNNTDLSQLLGCIASGYPFVFGFAVYSNFESNAVSKTGIVNMPMRKEKLLGGHAVLCVGYDMKTKRFIVRNSWGDNWGQNGYFTIPFEYLTNTYLADDFWTIKTIL